MKKFLALALLLAGGCANTTGNTDVQCRAIGATSATRPTGWTGTVFTIVMENKSRGDIVGNGDAPFINQLISQNALAAGYHDSFVHPSEPNYLWLVAGQNFGILNDNDPGSGNHIASTSHLADQIEAAGLTWKSYQESMGGACGLSSHGEYAAKHDPFIYFDDINGWDGSALHQTQRCLDHVVDYSSFDADLASGKLADYVFITPNLVSDMHDGSIADGDKWLSQQVPKILGSDAFNQGGVLFLLWDEGGGYPQSDDPPFIAISSNAKRGFVSQTPFDGSSYLKTVQTILGLESLPCGAPTAASTVQTMAELFTMPMPL